jgi:hypothetical protein
MTVELIVKAALEDSSALGVAEAQALTGDREAIIRVVVALRSLRSVAKLLLATRSSYDGECDAAELTRFEGCLAGIEADDDE